MNLSLLKIIKMSTIDLKNYSFHNVIVFPKFIFMAGAKCIGDLYPCYREVYRWFFLRMESIKSIRNEPMVEEEGEEIGDQDRIYIYNRNTVFFYQKIPMKDSEDSCFAIHILSREEHFLNEIDKSIRKAKNTNRESEEFMEDKTNDLNISRKTFRSSKPTSGPDKPNGMVFKEQTKKRKRAEKTDFRSIDTIENYIRMFAAYKCLKEYNSTEELSTRINLSKLEINNYFTVKYAKEILESIGADVVKFEDALNIHQEDTSIKDISFILTKEFFKFIDVDDFMISTIEESRFPFQDTNEIVFLDRLYKYQSTTATNLLQNDADFIKNKAFIEKMMRLCAYVTDEQKMSNMINRKNIITLFEADGTKTFNPIRHYLNSSRSRGERNRLIDTVIKQYKEKSAEEIGMVMESKSSEVHGILPDSFVGVICYKNSKKDDNGNFQFFQVPIINKSDVNAEDRIVSKKTDIMMLPTKIQFFNKEIDPMSNFIVWLSKVMKAAHLSYISPLIIMYISTLSVLLSGLKLNVLIQGDPSIGKSHLLDWVEKCLPEGVHRTWASNPSNNHLFTKDANMRSVSTVLAHEGSNFLSNGKEVDKEAKNLFKTLLSEGKISKQVLEFDPETGERIGSDYKTETHVNMIAATNLEPQWFDMTVIARFIVFYLTPNGDIKEGMRSKSINDTINSEGEEIMYSTMKDLYSLCYMVLVGIKKKTVSEPTCIVTDIILYKIETSFKEYGISINDASRGYEQIRSIIKLLTIMGAVIKVCLTPGGALFNKPFNYKEFYSAIDKELYVTIQTVVTAICLCFDTFQSKSQVDLIKHVFEKKLKFTDTLNDFEVRSMRLNTDVEYNKQHHHDESIEEIGTDEYGKSKRNFYGFVDVSVHSLNRFNYNYHLFIVNKNSSSDSIFRKVMGKIGGKSTGEVYYDLNYVSFKYEKLSDLFNKESEIIIKGFEKANVIPKNVLQYVEKTIFEENQAYFFSSEQRENCAGKSRVEADDYLRANCSYLRCGEGGENIFQPILEKGHFYKNSDPVYDKKVGLPLVIDEEWNPAFEKQTDPTHMNHEERNARRKNYRQISFAIELFRLKFKLLLENAIKKLSYENMKPKEIMMFMLEDDIYKSIPLKPTKGVKLEIKNPNYVKTDEKSIMNSLTSVKYDKDDVDLDKKFKIIKSTEIIGHIDSETEYQEKLSYRDKGKTYFETLKEIYSKKTIIINEDLDLFAMRIHGEKTGVPYEEMEDGELPQKKAYDAYKKYMTSSENSHFREAFDEFDGRKMTIHATFEKSTDFEKNSERDNENTNNETTNTFSNGNSEDDGTRPNFTNNEFINKK